MSKETVTLFGASGTMGWQGFLELWRRRERYQIVLLLRPSAQNKRRFARYEREAGIRPIPGRGVVQGGGLKIVWGDATHYADVVEAVRGTDWVLDAMAFISPQADYYPEQAQAVNCDAICQIVQAIEAEPGGAERIRLVYTGTVAETGDRPGGIHHGRVGDPLKPSIFDYYAVTKIAGERAVLESSLRFWASLRMTFIMPTDYGEYAGLLDPILFHQPLASFMENVSDRDAGLGLVNTLDVPAESGFWRRVYNMGGGPQMRTTALEFLRRSHQLLGLSGVEAVTERRWFALRNFHMQYYEDSHELNEYLHYWRDNLEDYYAVLYRTVPAPLKAVASLSRRVPALRRQVERATRARLRTLAENHRNGTAYWYNSRNDARITAFFKDYATYEAIPDWGVEPPAIDLEPEWRRLDHGYDEGRAQLDLADLQAAARFRGGECLAEEWAGDWYAPLAWRCAFGHEFSGQPYTILKAGHWCPVCIAPPWNYDEEARRNPFFAQVWQPNHDPGEDNVYPADCVQDIAAADRDRCS